MHDTMTIFQIELRDGYDDDGHAYFVLSHSEQQAVNEFAGETVTIHVSVRGGVEQHCFACIDPRGDFRKYSIRGVGPAKPGTVLGR